MAIIFAEATRKKLGNNPKNQKARNAGSGKLKAADLRTQHGLRVTWGAPAYPADENVSGHSIRKRSCVKGPVGQDSPDSECLGQQDDVDDKK